MLRYCTTLMYDGHMKHNNSKFKKFWRSLPVSERKVICKKSGRSFQHVEFVACGSRPMIPNTAFRLIDADKRITMEMCFPERFK